MAGRGKGGEGQALSLVQKKRGMPKYCPEVSRVWQGALAKYGSPKKAPWKRSRGRTNDPQRHPKEGATQILIQQQSIRRVGGAANCRST